jgi:hypothetical protein
MADLIKKEVIKKREEAFFDNSYYGYNLDVHI